MVTHKFLSISEFWVIKLEEKLTSVSAIQVCSRKFHAER